MKAVGIVACSNPQKPAYKDQNETLIQFLKKNGKRVLISDCLYEKGSAYTYTGAERAAALMQLFRNPEVDELFKQQLLETDPDARADCFHQIAKIISDDVPWIPMYNKATSAGLSDRVQNFTADFRGVNFQIEKWTLAE